MVRELTELQGTMGGIYAREEGLPEPIWRAIYYHYLPVGVEAEAAPSRAELAPRPPSRGPPWLARRQGRTRWSALFAAGERPTGTRDPFGLRRQAHGLLKILVDLPELTGLSTRPVDLAALRRGGARRRSTACAEPGVALPQDEGGEHDDLSTFLGERLRYLFQQRGFAYDEVNAIAGSPARLRGRALRRRLRLEALPRVRASADFEALAVAFKRVKNLSRRADEAEPSQRPGPLTEPAEARCWPRRSGRAAAAIVSGGQAAGLRGGVPPGVAASAPAVDRFFTEVFVMVDDARAAGAAAHARMAAARADPGSGRHLGNRSSSRIESLTRSFNSSVPHTVESDAMAKKKAVKKPAGRPQRRSGAGEGESRRREREEGRAGQGAWDQVRLLLRRRQGRRRPHDEGPARRQGLRPGRDDQRRPSGAPGLHDHHRGLQPLLRARAEGAGRRSRRRWKRTCGGSRRSAGQKFGSTTNPLLVSVRSGAKFSMPGMMDTILNLGLNDEAVEGLKKRTGNGRFAYDSYRRFMQMFGNVVLEIPKEEFEKEFDAVKERAGREARHGSRRAGAASEVVQRYKEVVKREDRQELPERSDGAAAWRPQRRVPLLEQPAREVSTVASTTSRTTSAPPSTCS